MGLLAYYAFVGGVSVAIRSKRFSPGLDSLYDDDGIRTVAEFFVGRGWDVEIKPFGKKGVDLRVLKNNRQIYVDAEVRLVWRYGQFPFSMVHIPARKRKFLLQYRPIWFAAVRRDLQAILFVPGDRLRDNMIYRRDNKYMDRESFYAAPIGLTYTYYV